MLLHFQNAINPVEINYIFVLIMLHKDFLSVMLIYLCYPTKLHMYEHSFQTNV